MNDPRIPSPGFGEEPPFGGASSSLNLGSVGLLFCLAIMLLVAVMSGVATGVWLVACFIGVSILAVLIRWRLRVEQRKRPVARDSSSLPDDAELSDLQRHEAMREYEQHHPKL